MITTHKNPITVKRETITPEIAERMLSFNINNRPLNERHVDRLAREMSLKRWKLNGDTICLNGSRLIDGQHRLAACIQSKSTFETLVVYGVDSDVFDTKDVGRARTSADTLSILGEINTTRLAAALALFDRYMTGRMTNTAVRYTNQDIQDLLKKYPDMREVCNDSVHRRIIQPSVKVACHYLFRQIDREQADQFISDVLRGHDLPEDDPVLVLRERLMSNIMGKAKLRSEYIMALIIKTWNSRRVGKPLRSLKWRTEGDKPEEFPIAI